LISLGADLGAKDVSNGRTALHHVAATGNLPLLRLLVS
jgi:ankyrin repeat protein